jgi:hypothetical protein
MTNDELVEKLINKVMDLYESKSVRQRDIERFNNIREEIIFRMDLKKEIEKEYEENIMTPDHLEWEEFCNILNDRINLYGCDAETLTQAEYILSKYFPNIDVEKSLEYFREHGGYCDCEILMNVAGN